MSHSFNFYEMNQEAKMGLYDNLNLDKNVDRNSFTKEQAAQIFEKAARDVQSGAVSADMIEKLLDAGFNILKIFAATQA